MDKVIGYTAGVFDLFHIGHLNTIKYLSDQAKKNNSEAYIGLTNTNDIEIINAELILADLEIVENRISKIEIKLF